MQQSVNRQVYLNSRPGGIPLAANFSLRVTEVPRLEEGEILIISIITGSRTWSNLLMTPGICDCVTGEAIMMDGANAVATGVNFHAPAEWTEDTLTRARQNIAVQNDKDRAPQLGPPDSEYFLPMITTGGK